VGKDKLAEEATDAGAKAIVVKPLEEDSFLPLITSILE